MTASLIVVDVNPGGDCWTDGYLGVVELVDDEITTSFELSYRHPVGRLQDGRMGPVEEFRTAWAFFEAFVNGRTVVAYNAQYDLGALGRMLVRAELDPPPMRFVCAYKLRQEQVGRKDVTVWQSVRELGLIPPEEIAALHEAAGMGCIGSLDDARACALLWVWMAEQEGVSPGELAARRPSRCLTTAPAFRPGRPRKLLKEAPMATIVSREAWGNPWAPARDPLPPLSDEAVHLPLMGYEVDDLWADD